MNRDSAAAKPSGTAAPSSTNPFLGARFYLDPEYARNVESSALAHPADAALLRRVKDFPTGLWIDSIAKVERVPEWLAEARRQEEAAGQPVVPVFVVYDLPGRDCGAAASAGELSVETGGEERYRREFIDRLAEIFAANRSQRIVAIVEPDSLPNLATNLALPRCAASAAAYRRSIAYAISRLSLPHVSLYLDAAHAGWLGWNNNRRAIAELFAEVLAQAGGADRIRGFATNVSNYNALRGGNGADLEPSNPCPDELTYVEKLAATLESVGIAGKGFIVDTGRSGRGDVRTSWGSWCNIRGAGLGERPAIAPVPAVDAYFWVKPPGDSDGTSDPAAARFDANCASKDAAPGAPEAGRWFDAHFLELARNARPPL